MGSWGRKGTTRLSWQIYGVATLGMCNDDGEGGDCPAIENNGVGRDKKGLMVWAFFFCDRGPSFEKSLGSSWIAEKEGGNVVYITA